MIKKLLMLLLLAGTVGGSTLFDNLGEFKVGVRSQLAKGSTAYITDSVLTELAGRAIVYTSVAVGGVETTFKIDLGADTAFYEVPDSIVEVVYATLISSDQTKSIKAFPPAFVEDVLTLTTLDSDNEDAKPMAFNFWADTMQVIPAAAQADSIYLKCFVRHRSFETGDDTTVIQMNDGYQEAALFYACFLVEDRCQNYQVADRYYAIYEKMKAGLQEKFARKVDMLRTGN